MRRISATSSRGRAAGAEAGGGLDEVRARQFRQRAGDGFLLVVEQRRFDDDFHDRAAAVGEASTTASISCMTVS